MYLEGPHTKQAELRSSFGDAFYLPGFLCKHQDRRGHAECSWNERSVTGTGHFIVATAAEGGQGASCTVFGRQHELPEMSAVIAIS